MNVVGFVPLSRPTADRKLTVRTTGITSLRSAPAPRIWYRQSAVQSNSPGPLRGNDAGVDALTDIVDAPPNKSC